jgi:AAHS family 4-hydroxybenzoate transporter-like MFS transporter
MRQPDTIDIGSVIETQASSWYSHLVVILCCVAMVIEGYDAQVLAYAAPAIIRDWNIEQSYFGPVFGAALFGYMLGATLLTGVSDGSARAALISLLSFMMISTGGLLGAPIPNHVVTS